MISVITTAWFGEDGERVSPGAGQLSSEAMVMEAMRHRGWVLVELRDGDAELHFDSRRAQPTAVAGANRWVVELGAIVRSLEIVDNARGAGGNRILSKLEAGEEGKYAGMMSF